MLMRQADLSIPLLPCYTSESLSALIRSHDREAFDHLYQQYACRLLQAIRLIVREEEVALEVLRESFIRIWNEFKTVLPEESARYGRMQVIACRAALEVRAGRSGQAEQEPAGSVPAADHSRQAVL